jgi:hypothetical protein
MSGIQLSPELIDDLKAVLVKHDPETANDLLLIQYLSAVSGFVLAHQGQPGLDKKAFLDDVRTFTGQVLDQVESDMQAPQQQEEAFGVWKPE